VKELLAEFSRNKDGQLVLGDPNKGCKFCGTVEMKVAANGKAVYYHPGVECCVQALELQIKFRQGEMRQLGRKIAQHNLELSRLEETVDAYGSSTSSQASEARMKLEKAKRGLQKQVDALQGNFGVTDEEAEEANFVGIKQLKLEITRLEKKLGWIRGRAA
jgi:hypothetical protein